MKKHILVGLDFHDVDLIERALSDFKREYIKCAPSAGKDRVFEAVADLERRIKKAEMDYILK